MKTRQLVLTLLSLGVAAVTCCGADAPCTMRCARCGASSSCLASIGGAALPNVGAGATTPVSRGCRRRVNPFAALPTSASARAIKKSLLRTRVIGRRILMDCAMHVSHSGQDGDRETPVRAG